MYPCPCCGQETLPTPAASALAFVCPVCLWENDVFLSSPRESSDENHGLTFRQARRNYKRFGVCDKRYHLSVGQNSSLWNSKRAFHIRRHVDWHFRHLGTDCRIPYVMQLRNAIVFDLLSFPEDEKVRTYYERYGCTETEAYPTRQRMAVESASPLQGIDISSIQINGFVSREFSSSAAPVLPFLPLDETARRLLAHYGKKYGADHSFSFASVFLFLFTLPTTSQGDG